MLLLRNVIIFLSLFLFSLFIKKEVNPLPGKIAVNFGDTMYIYNNSDKYESCFSINGITTTYAGFRWTNMENMLVGVEYVYKEGSIERGNLNLFNVYGKVVKSIYGARSGEIAGQAYLSKNHKLLFTVEKKGNISIDPVEGLNRKKSILVQELSGELLIRIEDIGKSSRIQIHESPWLCDEAHFVFSLSSNREFKTDFLSTSLKEEQDGVYIYDIFKNERELLVPGGEFPVCSPLNREVAFVKEKSIYIIDLSEKKIKKLFDVGLEDQVINIHWTPDGLGVYIAYYKRITNGNILPVEKLISLDKGQEIFFKKIGHGFRSYTWK